MIFLGVRWYFWGYTIKQLVTIRLTVNVVECLHEGLRVALHVRSYIKGKPTTLPEHMPVAHQRYSEWNPGRFLKWALDIGPCTHDVIQHLLKKSAHPEQGYRTCFGTLTLAKRYSKERLEAACYRALAIGSPKRRSILSILEKGLDQQPLQKEEPASVTLHENIRGAKHYQNELDFLIH